MFLRNTVFHSGSNFIPMKINCLQFGRIVSVCREPLQPWHGGKGKLDTGSCTLLCCTILSGDIILSCVRVFSAHCTCCIIGLVLVNQQVENNRTACRDHYNHCQVYQQLMELVEQHDKATDNVKVYQQLKELKEQHVGPLLMYRCTSS